MSSDFWFLEERGTHDWHMYGIKSHLYHHQSEFQRIEIVDTFDYGRCLILDGKARVFEVDEFIFHESIIHPSLMAHKHPKRVLMVGDGDCGGVREILRHKSVELLTWVEIDEAVLEASQKFLHLLDSDPFSDPRIQLRFEDARQFIQSSDVQYDVIIVSATEPLRDNPSQKLYTIEFAELVKTRLAPNGIFVQSSGSTDFGYLNNFCTLHNTYGRVFKHIYGYHVGLPSFGMHWGFLIGCQEDYADTFSPKSAINLAKLVDGSKLKFYSPEIHTTLFTFPPYFYSALATNDPISTDKNPISVD